jgi:oxygen-independent coproporphyrinogen-3 oxidase
MSLRIPTLSTVPGLYLHLPFCSAICPYCDFSVLTGGEEAREAFVLDLEREIELWAGSEWPSGFDTVYFGGGTPSALRPDQIGRILATARRHLPVRDDAFVQLEANPEDVTPATVAAWRDLGVGFLSLGVQSLDDAALRFLGRRHSASAARQAVETALESGIPVVSLDLIYGRPDQTVDAWRHELAAAIALGAPHLSCYQLTIHDRTPFGFRAQRGRMRPVGSDEEASFFLATHEEAEGRGIPAYEVSNFARRPAVRSPHNQKYWHHVPYLGLGPSAHSFDGRARWWNDRKLGPWSRRVRAGERPVADRELPTPEQRALEILLLGLRTREGVTVARLVTECGFDPLDEHRSLITGLVRQGLLHRPSQHLRATLAGWAVADGLASRLAPPPPIHDTIESL